MRTAIRLSLLALFIPSASFSNIATDMDNFFQKSGFSSNATSPAAFESQASGFYGGGSLYARNQVHEYQLATLDLPTASAGCAGIDLWTGSLSYLSNEKLVELGKQVMTNSGAYAVDVMLATTVPELKQVRDFLQTVAQKINQMSINSCEMAQNLVGGMFPKTAASQEKVCNDQRRMGNSALGHDYVASRMECNEKSQHDAAMASAEADPKRKQQVVLNKNIVWSLIKAKGFLSQDDALAEMAMSLTGTIIVDKEGHVTNVPTLVGSQTLVAALIGSPLEESRTAKLWHCGESTRCLTVSLTEVTIPAQSSLSSHVHKTILSINTKLKADTALTAAEKNFLALTPIPVLKFLSVLGQTEYGDTALDMAEYSNLIAQDLMQHYLSELLQEVSNATFGSEIPEDLLREIRERIEKANEKIAAIEPQVGRKLIEKLSLINNVARVEKQTASSLNGLS